MQRQSFCTFTILIDSDLLFLQQFQKNFYLFTFFVKKNGRQKNISVGRLAY